MSGVRYYPDFVERLHLRSLYRVLKEPTRLIPRYTVDSGPFYRGVTSLSVGRMRAHWRESAP